MIEFKGHKLNFERLDLDKYVFIEDKLIEKDRRKCEELAYRVLSGEISIFLERSGNVSKIERSVNGDEI